jgi:hypothetical protein
MRMEVYECATVQLAQQRWKTEKHTKRHAQRSSRRTQVPKTQHNCIMDITVDESISSILIAPSAHHITYAMFQARNSFLKAQQSILPSSLTSIQATGTSSVVKDRTHVNDRMSHILQNNIDNNVRTNRQTEATNTP